jgi:uncharacterized protein (DUF983 family)
MLSLPGGGEQPPPFGLEYLQQEAKLQAMTTRDAPSLASTIISGLLGRCPACGRGKMFSGYLTLAPRCNVCGLDYSFADSGDGPAVFVILVTGFNVVGAALYEEMVYAPPYWLHAALWGPLAILLPLLLLRSVKGVLIALQYKHKAQEGRLASE